MRDLDKIILCFIFFFFVFFLIGRYAIFFQLPILPELYLRAYDLELAYINDLYVGASEEEIEAYKFVLSKPGKQRISIV